MKLPHRRILSPLARPFPERARAWRRFRPPEAEVLPLDGGAVLRRFSLPATVDALRGRRIAFFSDLHFHATPDEERRVSAFAEALEKFHPEVLLAGGDLTGDACDLHLLKTALRRLSERVPLALTIPGNWEREIGRAHV